MSQNTPPGMPPEEQRYDADGQPVPNASNPYYNRVDPQPAPDLDAAAPQLRTAEERRLNRKALLFLGGILLLILVMGFLLLRKGQDDSAETQRRTEAARPTTPELPTIAQPAPPPTEVAAIPMLPQAPVDDTSNQLVPLAPQRSYDEGPRMPTLLERRIAAGEAMGGGQGQGQGPQPGGIDEASRAALIAQLNGNQQQAGPMKVQRGADVEDISNASFIRSPDALLVRGTFLRCVLETRIITDIAGYTSCLVTEPVYSINGRTLLLPKGSKIYGSYGGGPIGERVDVIWDRITTPNGLDVAMSSPGTDGMGGAGIPGQYSAHWGERIGKALMISLIADAFKYAAAENGPETTAVNANGFAVQSPYESATARTLERLAGDALADRRPPTVTVNQGTILNVYVAKDVDFSAVLRR